MPFLDVRALTKSYTVGEGQLHVLRALDLGVDQGEMVAVVGASGVGKSTLLQLIGGLDRVDGVLYTHHHADHVLGFDELRIFNFVHRVSIPLYGRSETMDAIRHMFAYAFDGNARGVPRIDVHATDGPFDVRGVHVIPVPVEHDRLTISAYRIGNFAYITDCSGIPESSAAMLRGVEIIVIDALRRTPHPAHFTLTEALQEIERLEVGTAYLTHLSHEFDHGELEKELPEGVHVAYDGLVLEADEATP